MIRDADRVGIELEERLLRFLEREEADEQRSHDEPRALPVADRVIDGECIDAAELLEVTRDGVRLRIGENASKFRDGDPIALGDGLDFTRAAPFVYGAYDPLRGELRLERDRYSKGEDLRLDVGRSYVIDRRPLGLRGRLKEAVRSGFAEPAIHAVLAGEHEIRRDEARFGRAVEALRAVGLDPAQVEAGATAIATESLALVQGPPGTGKTRMLAEVLRLLVRAGCKIVLSAFTHRAVDNVLLALRRLDPTLLLFKVGNSGGGIDELRAARVRLCPAHRLELPSAQGAVVAGTPFALERMPPKVGFHYAVFDEAGQLPIPHAIAGMLLARRWVFVGDHRQLPPVVTGNHEDPLATRSVFEHLHQRFGSAMLDRSYRMNDGVCRVIGATFYDGRLHSAESAAPRRMAFAAGGTFDAILDPALAVVVARIDHLQPGNRSHEEAELCADLVAETVQRHGTSPREICVIAPFRAQVRLLRTAIERRGIDVGELIVDTVERVQGQEREVVFVSLACGDPSTLDRRSTFFFSPNRLNVALSRARTKAVLVASIGVVRALPMDPDGLRAASIYKALWNSLPQVDMTAVYGPRVRSR